jgi:hypothetical protein
MRSRFLVLLAALAPAPAASEAADAPGLQLALDGAADLTPVYPTTTLPANAREFAVIFTYGDQKMHHVGFTFDPIDATGAYRISTGGQADVAAVGDGSRFLLRPQFLTDIPVGRWRFAATVDDQTVGSEEIKVVAAMAPLKIAGPIELAGSLTAGSEWNFKFRLFQEPAPGLKLTVDGIDQADAAGWLNTTLVRKAAARDAEGTRWDMIRTGKLLMSQWAIATDRGIAVTKTESDGNDQAINPPELTVAMPTDRFHQTWQWNVKGGNPDHAQRFQMWGPLPIETPQGERPGYVVLQKIPDDDDPSKTGFSAELHIVPGLGVVHETDIQPIPQIGAATRTEFDLVSMTHGQGPEPEIRKYPED